MRLEHFRQVQEIVSAGSISKAAEQLFISQASLSLSIKNLEDELGQPVFERSSRGVQLTRFGQECMKAAESILLQVEHLKKVARGAGEFAPSQRISICNGGWRCVSLAAAELYKRHVHDKIRLEIHEAAYIAGAEKVIERVCDIGLIGLHSFRKRAVLRLFESQNLQYYRINTNPVTITVRHGHPVLSGVKDGVISRDQLEGYPLIMRCTPDDPAFAIVEKAGLNLHRDIIVANGRLSQFELIDATDGFAVTTASPIFDRRFGTAGDRVNLVLADCAITGEIGWVKRKDTVLQPLALEFLQIISNYYVE